MAVLYIFNESGLEIFHEYLINNKNKYSENFKFSMLYDKKYCTPVYGAKPFEQKIFKNKGEAAKYINEIIENATIEDKYYNPYLWGWLSAYFFDSVCPIKNGKRNIRNVYRYIPNHEKDWRNYYRHLLAFPLRIYEFHGDMPKILLSGPVHQVGDFVEQIGSRQNLAMNKGVLEAANLLYWDNSANKPKVGALATGRRKGALRRFINVINQLDKTYDLFSMSGKEIISLLPKEFEMWRS